LVISNNEFILVSAHVGSEMISWIASDKHNWQLFSQKVTRIVSHHLYCSMCSKCPPPAGVQAVDVDTTLQQQVQ